MLQKVSLRFLNENTNNFSGLHESEGFEVTVGVSAA